MDILSLAKDWSDPAIVGSVIVALVVTVKFLLSRTKRVEDTVVNLRDNHLHEIGKELNSQSKSLVRIETTLEHLPCVKDKSCSLED